MFMKKFWVNWKHKTDAEKRAIVGLENARKILLRNIPKSKLIAVYLKGSFVRREMNEKSDVDIVPIVSSNRYLQVIKRLQEKHRMEYAPADFTPISLWELKHNQKHDPKEMKSSPDVFVKNIQSAQLIYGRPLDTTNYKVRDDTKQLGGLLNAFHKKIIPKYEDKEFGFSQIIKCVFYIVDLEQKIKGNHKPYSFKGLARSVKDNKHIVHDALKLRLHPTKNKIVRAKFMKKLKEYILEMEKLVK